MKKLIILILTILAMAISINAADLKWDNPVPMENDGTKVYYQTPGEDQFSKKFDGNQELINIGLLNLTPGLPYDIWIVGYLQDNESAKSNTVIYTLPLPTNTVDDNPKPVVVYLAIPIQGQLTISPGD